MKWKPLVFWLAGVSFLWAWSFSFVLPAESGVSTPWGEVANAFYLVSSLITTGFCILLFQKSHSVSHTSMNLATGFLVVASFLIVWGEHTATAPMIWLGKLLGGPGQALAWILWTYEIARYDLEDIDASFLVWMISLFLFLVVIAGIVSLPGIFAPVLRAAILVGCSLGSHWTFRRIMNSRPPTDEPLQEEGALGLGGERPEPPLSLGLLFTCLGVALAACFVVTSVSQQLCALDTGTVRLVYASAALVVFPIAWLVLRMTRQFGPASLYRWAVPTAVTGVVMYLLMPKGPIAAPNLAFALVTIGFESMYHLLFIYAVKRYLQRGLLVASVGILTMTVGGIIGSIAAAAIPSNRGALEAALLVSVAVFVIVAAVTPRSGGMSGLEGRHEIIDRRDKLPSSQDRELGDICRCFAKRYHLTPREEEVLELMMRGRSRAFIREALFISKGTVDTHINHIYKKADVNSKEALERLVHETA